MGWRIKDIEKPSVEERTIQEIIEPGDMAIATSGDYRNYFERDGVRYPHIINPETGKPLHHKVVSVTVLNPSSMTADGLSTGSFLWSVEVRGMEIANQHNIPAFMVVKTADGLKRNCFRSRFSYLGKYASERIVMNSISDCYLVFFCRDLQQCRLAILSKRKLWKVVVVV